ncbi:response regulator transcription factor [Metabacillus litoralis]|uniref:response regulator transcription factor n=1 Tax=Metabacillus litoralis TaxID=152268 RepID=UPI001CFD20C7|nr:helix-turn-helix domain-containing protein [Metabacillus litoralis]
MPRRIKTIIVDDEARLRRGVERLVQTNGDSWEVVGSFSSGDECLNAFQKEGLLFDLLITDVKMPGMDGLTLIKKLKQLTSFHAMVISGFDDFQFLQTAIREGASDYLIKPIDRDDFKIQLEEMKSKIISQWNDTEHIEEIEFKASQVTHVKQLQLLSEITWNHDIDLSQLEWTKDFPDGSYRLIFISVDNLYSRTKSFEKEDWKAWRFALDNICKEMEDNLDSSTFTSWRWSGDDLSFWLLLHVQENEEKLLGKICVTFSENIKINIQKYTPFTSSIAISEEFNELTLLTSLREELLMYMQFRLLLGGNKVITSEEIEKLKAGIKANKSQEIENQVNKIIFTLDSKDSDKIKVEISVLLKMIKILNNPEEIEKSFHLLGFQIINYLIKHTQEKDTISLMNEVFVLTKKIGNLSELTNEVYDWIKKILLILESKNEEQNPDQIGIAKKWILTHLDQNITIQNIANQVYMNPTYFCKYFKTQTGETVLDFVTRIRIEKARDLLLSTNLKIYDISERVGYSDTKYFSKLFKKQYGETPSKYKDKMMLDQRKLPF